MQMISLTRLLGFFKKPAVAVPAEEKWLYVRITGNASGPDGELLWTWREAVAAPNGEWEDGAREGLAREANGGDPISPLPFITVIRRDAAAGWFFFAVTRGC
jgi:hypothetical protein